MRRSGNCGLCKRSKAGQHRNEKKEKDKESIEETH
jgi:hypothetical protein